MLSGTFLSRVASSLGAMALCLAILATPAAQAQWTNGNADNDWENPANWGGATPTGVNATVNLAGADRAVISATPSFGIVDLFVGGGAGNTGEVDQLAGVHGTGAGNWGFIGDVGGTGTYNLAKTDSTTAPGTLTGVDTGSGDFSAGRLYVGIGGGSNGTLNVNTTGTVSTTNLGESFVIGANSGTGVTNLDNGTITTPGEFQIGRTGDGTLNMSGGVAEAGEWFVIGRNGGSSGELNMTGGQINSSTTLASSFLVLGSFGGSTGTANVSGSSIINATGGQGLFVGEGGSGTLSLADSATVNANAIRLGLNDGSDGLLSLNGSNLNISAVDISLGLTGDLTTDSTGVGTISFTADASGVSTILASGDVNLSSVDGDMLSVDLTALTPGVGLHSDILLIDGATRQGIFTGLPQGTLTASDGSGNPYYIDYVGSTGNGDVWLRTTQVVPAPASLTMLSLAGLGLMGRRRR